LIDSIVATRRGSFLTAFRGQTSTAKVVRPLRGHKKIIVGYMVPNFCSGETGAIGAWNTAAHVEAPPKKRDPPTP